MKMVKGIIAVSLVAFLGLMGAVSMAEARYVGHGYHHGIARGYGGYRHYGYGRYRHYGYGYGRYRHYGYGYGRYYGRGYYGRYRRYGYYGGYYGGGCGWLYRNALATGNRYWWNRYLACSVGQ
jgi:hypothetical protein